MPKRKSRPLTINGERKAEKARREKVNEKQRLRRLDPVYRAAENEKRARYRALRRQDPVFRAADNAKRNERRRLKMQDPAYRAAVNARNARSKAIRRLDPVYRAADNAKKRLQKQKRNAEKAKNETKMQITKELADHGKQIQTNMTVDHSKLVDVPTSVSSVMCDVKIKEELKVEPVDHMDIQ